MTADQYAELMRVLGRIEGRLDGIPERVRKLEIWQAWLKGAWVALIAPWAYLTRHAPGR